MLMKGTRFARLIVIVIAHDDKNIEELYLKDMESVGECWGIGRSFEVERKSYLKISQILGGT